MNQEILKNLSQLYDRVMQTESPDIREEVATMLCTMSSLAALVDKMDRRIKQLEALHV